MQKVKLHLVLLILALVLLFAAIFLNKLYTYSLADIALKTSSRISEKAERAKDALKQLLNSVPETKQESFLRLFEKQKIGLYLFRQDSLVYWNNAQIAVETDPSQFSGTKGFVKLRHGYYLYVKLSGAGGVALALCLVKPAYDLQNNYLKNYFAAWTDIPKGVDLSTDPVGTYAVLLDNIYLFSLKGNEANYSPEWAGDAWFSLFTAGFFVLLIALLLRIKEGVPTPAFGLMVLALLCLRFVMLYLRWPHFFYKGALYDVQVFGDAQSLFNPYLGDLLWNALVIVFIAIGFHFQVRLSPGNTPKLLKQALLFALCLLGFDQFNQAVVSLVTNSTLDFDFLSIFTVKPPAFIGVVALAVYSTVLYVTLNQLILFFRKSRFGFLKFISTLTILCYLRSRMISIQQPLENYWLAVFGLALYLLSTLNISRAALGLGLQILFMSVITSLLLNFYIDKKQSQNLEFLSLELSERQDPILENEYLGIPAKIGSDDKLGILMLFLPNGKREIEQLLKQKYFDGYFNRYNVDVSLFDQDCNPLLSARKPELLDAGFLDEQIRYNSDSTGVPGLFFVKNYKNNSQYIGRIQLKEKRLYVILEPKQYDVLGSFPDLLLDQSQQNQEKLKNFSYAVYRARQNTTRYGEFSYPFFLLDSATLARSNSEYKHYYFNHGESVEVISQKTKTWGDKFTYNSYLFLFFSVLSYCAYFLYSILFTKRLQTPSLTRRIQTIIIVLLLLLMSAVGITSGGLVSSQFAADNRQQLQEKTEIIINELAGQFKPREFFDESQKENVKLKLNEYAHLFNTVISLFDRNGRLFNTSQPRLYELGLAASMANPKAFWNLKQDRSSAENVRETAGTLNYISLYTPLYDSKQQLLGFVNLPYFSGPSDLVKELSGIISALINVYVILFVISILAGLILSGYITQPLRLIKQQISNITLGRRNETIKWNSNDEIGRLVSEYNQMLAKLDHSASLLAQNERESAWREMAKQVAHEIKNPLTPMKLNLQYLQHLIKNNPDDFREKFEKTSAGIIEQIDSLAGIANEFSSFAKLPGASLEPVNLVEIINSSVLIFEHRKDILFKNTISENSLMVMGDKDQCLRVFNNILKNAVQALDEVESPLIEISAEEHLSSFVVRIKDNGCGIPEELKPKIFSPNFTTKTTGSGLGLAMVKNILQGFGGRIWFDSEQGSGASFYLEFNKA